MSLAGNLPVNTRQLQDSTFIQRTALVAGGVVSTAFDLVQATPYPTPEQIVLNLDLGTLAGSNTTAAFTVQDSADNSSFSNVSVLGAVTKTVPTDTGLFSASYARWSLPPSVKQYVRISASLSAATTGNFTASLVF